MNCAVDDLLVLVTPWLTAISVRTERHVLGSRYEPSNRTLWQSLIRSVRIGLRLAWWQLLFTAIFSLVAFVPVVGQVAGVMLFAIDSYYAGFGNYDYYLDRHYNYATSVRWVNAHRSAAFGNGLAFMLLLLVPVIGIALAPTLGVVAATLHALGEKEAKAV